MATGLLGISLSGLNAAQAGIKTAQHNISNINTTGFRRQEVNYAAAVNLSGGSLYGSGVGVASVRNLYSQFQDSQALHNQTQLSRNETYASQAGIVDSLISDNSSGLTSAMNSFFNAAQTVANDPTSNAARQVMLSAGNNLTSRVSTLANAFEDMRTESNREIASTVSTINGYAKQIAQLSGNIMSYEAGNQGQLANDLRDQRDQHVAELNKLINVTTVQQGDGPYNLFVGTGQALVTGTSVSTMVSQSDADNPQFNVPALVMGGGGVQPLDSSIVSGGKLGGILAVRESVLQPAMRDLDTLAYEFSSQFNAQHMAGFDKSGAQGIAFFTDLTTLEEPPKGAAVSMSMNAEMKDANLIAASATAEGIPGDNQNALLLAGLRTQPNTINDTDTFYSAYSQTVSRTATLASEADIAVAAFATLTQMSTQAQKSISGVNLDEEAVNLIRFQQAYQASAKALQVASALFADLLSAIR
jgi:flagellar hook-associated protein 1 FlgK